MSKEPSKLPTHNAYFNHDPQVEYFAVYDKGNFIDKNTNEPIQLKEGAFVRIVVANVFVLQKDFPQHNQRQEVEVFQPGEKFYFTLETKTDIYKFFLKNLEKIKLVKIGNKMPRFQYTSCEIYHGEDGSKQSLKDFKTIHASSFNEAFTRVSEKYRQGASAHTCNVYTTFFHVEKGRVDVIREALL